ncbi:MULTISPECIES: hypothetical protein [unclassified Kribbella]|uniref:hypothetical protein n=1 Tax=unclassified Kribbella TaxID=2644121 RepID=UPI0030161A80
MDDVREVGEELRRLADAEQLDPFDTATLLQRGRRGRRRRKLLAVGGTAVSVAAVAVAAAVLPNLDTAGDGSRVAGGGQDAGANSSFGPVPGVPRGEESAGQKLTEEEATRRCALRYPQYTRPLGRGMFVSGRTVEYETEVGQKFQECTIPGGDKPSAELIAAARRDPMPTSTAGQLRNCSVQLWVDLTNWRVTASDQVKGFATSLVAVSPSGRKAVSCLLDPSADGAMMSYRSNSMFLTLNALDDALDPVVPGGSGYAELRAGSSGSAHCPGTPCKGWYALEYGRVAANITKVRIQLTGYPQVHDVTVTDGWYAIAWLNRSFKGSDPHYTITGYDKTGKAVKVIAKT